MPRPTDEDRKKKEEEREKERDKEEVNQVTRFVNKVTKYLNALVAAGFTREEALPIVTKVVTVRPNNDD